MNIYAVNEGRPLQIFFFQDGTLQLNKSTLDHITYSMDTLNLKQLAFAEMIPESQNSSKVRYSSQILLRCSETSKDGRSFKWRKIESAQIYINPVPTGLRPGVYIWSMPFQVKLTDSLEMSVWSTFSVTSGKSPMHLKIANQFLTQIPEYISFVKLDLASKSINLHEEERCIQDSYIHHNMTDSVDEDFTPEVLLHEYSIGLCSDRLYSQPLSTFLKSILTIRQPKNENNIVETISYAEPDGDMSFLKTFDGLLREMSKVISNFKFPNNDRFNRRVQAYNVHMEHVKDLISSEGTISTHFTPLLLDFHSSALKLFNEKGQLAVDDFIGLGKRINHLNEYNNDLFLAACKTYLAICQVYNYLKIHAERQLAEGVKSELRTFYKERFVQLLKQDVYSANFLETYHLGLVKSLETILAQNYTLELLLSRTDWLSPIEAEFVKFISENEINILKGHRRLEKVVEELEMQYIDDVEEFLGENGNSLTIQHFKEKHAEIEANLEEEFEKSTIKSRKSVGNRQIDVYKDSLKFYVDKYKEKVEKDLLDKCEKFPSSTFPPQPASHSKISNSPLVFQFDTSRVTMGISRNGQVKILADEKDNILKNIKVGFDGSKFTFISTKEEECKATHVWRIWDEIQKRRRPKNLMINGKVHLITVDFLLALLFRKLKQVAETKTKEEYGHTMVILPFSFSPSQKRQVGNACEIAGFKAFQIVTDVLAITHHLRCYLRKKSRLENRRASFVLIIWQSGNNVDVSVFKERSTGKLEMMGHSANYIVREKWNHFERWYRLYTKQYAPDRLLIETSIACKILESKLKKFGAVISSAFVASATNELFNGLTSVAKQFCDDVETLTVTCLEAGINIAECGTNICNNITEIPNATILESGLSNQEHTPFEIEFTSTMVKNVKTYGNNVTNVVRFCEYGSSPTKEYRSNPIGRIEVMLPETCNVQKVTPKCIICRNGFLVIERMEYFDRASNSKRIIEPSMWEWKPSGVDQESNILLSNILKESLV